MVTKEEVRNLLSKYVTRFIYDEEIKSIEALTKKVDFDMELVIDDIESIRRFFFEKLGAKKYVITLEDLCKTSTGEIWNDLQDLQDLKTLEELLALGILVDVIKDDKKMRAEAFFNIGGNCIYLTPELLRLETIEEEHQYMEVMREHVLPHYKFEINRGRRIVEPKPHYTKQEVKDLLIFWFNNITENYPEEKYSIMFEELVSDNEERVLNAVCLLRLANRNQEEFYQSMIADPSLLFVERLNIQVRSFSEEGKEYFGEVKKLFLQELHRIEDELSFNHKKTL